MTEVEKPVRRVSFRYLLACDLSSPLLIACAHERYVFLLDQPTEVLWATP